MIPAHELAKKRLDVLHLPDPFDEIIGKPERGSSIMIHSEGGNGKSSFALQTMTMFTQFGKALYCAAEEGTGYTMQEKIKRLHLEHSPLVITGFHSLEVLKSDITKGKFSFVCVDSISETGIKPDEFGDLVDWLHDRGIINMHVFHATKTGDFLGASAFRHKVDCSIKVINGRPSTLATGKNRLGPLHESDVDFTQPIEGLRINPNHDTLRSFTESPTSPVYGLDCVPEHPLDEIRDNPVSPDEIYDAINKRLLSVLDTVGSLPWQKSWNPERSTIAGGSIPTNFVSKKPYRGINYFMLSIQENGELRDLTNPYFMTFNQINELGGTIKKGTKAIPAYYFNVGYAYYAQETGLEFFGYNRAKFIAFLNKNKGKIEGYNPDEPDGFIKLFELPFLRYYNVFHCAHVEGIDFGPLPSNKNTGKSEIERLAIGDAIWNSYPGKPKLLKSENGKAVYYPQLDVIEMPEIGAFKNAQAYYSTLFHEMVHSTGSTSRLNRLKSKPSKEDYAKEELIAELGAVYLCGESGILFSTIDNSAKYLRTWNKELKGYLETDNTFFFRACSASQAAVDLILNRNADLVPAYQDLLTKPATPQKKGIRSKKRPSTPKKETPQLALFRENPQGPYVYLGVVSKFHFVNEASPYGIKGAYVLLSNLEQNTLYIIPKKRIQKAEQPIQSTQAEEVFSEWHQYQADHKDLKMIWPDEKETPIGTASEIYYLSDKIMKEGDAKNKVHHYHHEFDAGKRPVFALDDILIVKHITWNERGIIN